MIKNKKPWEKPMVKKKKKTMVFVEPSSRIYKETEGSEWDLFDEWKGKAMVLFGYQFSGCPWFDQCLTNSQMIQCSLRSKYQGLLCSWEKELEIQEKKDPTIQRLRQEMT